jgi:hypothetical protein
MPAQFHFNVNLRRRHVNFPLKCIKCSVQYIPPSVRLVLSTFQPMRKVRDNNSLLIKEIGTQLFDFAESVMVREA